MPMWLAFEAVKCAERQSLALADDLDWAIRVAFFAQSRCISLRHVLLELAQQVDLDRERFADDFDRGVTKYQVLQEAQEGWNYHLFQSAEIDGSNDYVAIERIPSHEAYQWMVDFVDEMVVPADEPAAEQLFMALRGKGAFHRFQETLHRVDGQWLQAWYQWRNRRLEAARET